ncbi:MAG: ferrochelatase, partial [Pontibacterium sp.]
MKDQSTGQVGALNLPKTAVILANLGTPDEPTPSAVKRYLNEFLSDSRVVEGKCVRRLLWLAVLKGIILQVRPSRVAKAYASIWEGDSPMRTILNQQVAELKLNLQNVLGENTPEVFSAMTYGRPGLTPLLRDLKREGYTRLLVVPMYPQYSASTTAAIYDQVAKFQLKQRDVMDIRLVKSYCDHPAYIKALASVVKRHRAELPSADKLVFSYHGIPKEYADKGDPYPHECERTSNALAAELGLADDEWMMTYQSRFGPKEWLQPYTDKTLEAFPAKGVKRLHIMSPAFTADCLETLEEIAEENKEVFEEAGGEAYDYIPAVNSEPEFISCLSELVLT